MTDSLFPFRRIWLVDFEFHQPPGETPLPICMVAREFRSGDTFRIWHDELERMGVAPFDVGSEDLFVAYYASAELGCFLSLGWLLPARILDLFTEFRCLTNGRATIAGNGLLGAMAHFGLGAIGAAEKGDLRRLAIRGGPFTERERDDLLAYCETDVVALSKLLPAMFPNIDLPRALFRGRYMAAVARIERRGVPIDTDTLNAIRDEWEPIKSQLVKEVDRGFGVYVPTGSKVSTPIADAADRHDVDPYDLTEVARDLWQDEQRMHGEFRSAVREARKTTGLTRNRIERWENRGQDYSTYPSLDTMAREIAGQYPELGLGRGYVGDDVYDDTNYAGPLWEILRDTDDRGPKRDDPEILNQAAGYLDEIEPGDLRYSHPLSFSVARFGQWLAANGIPWPRTDTGQLSLSDDTFRQMARMHPEVAPLRELRHTLAELRLESLAVGRDGRNRCLLSPFRSVTGRNQPSNAQFIFGPSCWLRGLIKPEPGQAIAYVDWSQQEFGIAAALSGDQSMQAAYTSGDPYLTFAKQAGAVPKDATKQSHSAEREQFKVCALAVQYGMGAKSLAQSLGQPEASARELLRLHKATYPKFWKWSQAAVDHALLLGWLQTTFGWRVRVGPKANPRSLANFPMQANGADMLRLACCLLTEAGIGVCAPVHDAVLVEAPDPEIDAAVARTQKLMAEASCVVLDGFRLRSDAEIVRYPNRYMDKRGRRMWDVVTGLLNTEPPNDVGRADTGNLIHADTGTCIAPIHPYLLISPF